MDQKEINEAEWKNPANLRTGFYYSKKDSRTWVPKQTPWMGWTWNFGRAGAWWWLLFFLVGLPALIILVFGTLTHWK